MSDDKREKLREYLRNNRPKNRVNSGNNSNNKENSNKNLNSKKYENLHNSTLKNNIDDNLKSNKNLNSKNNESVKLKNENLKKNLSSSKENLNNQLNLQNNINQNSNNSEKNSNSNKNSNSSNFTIKRDYDKEPIIIKDNNLNLFFISSITCIFLVLLTWGYFEQSQSFLYTSIIAMISGIAYFREYFESANTRFICFNNSSIIYLNPRREIKLKNIKKVRRTFSIKYDRYGGILYNKIAVIFIFLSLFIIFFHSLLFKGLKEMFFIFFGFCFCIFMPKFLLYLKNGGLIFKYKLFDAVVISDENTFINILPNDEMERNLLKRYFLDTKKINIENSKITFFII
ncbi:hypothetical protein [Campylobacter ureolyticus]|uniref:hypothetical protein n=4 Tax=Campylobacter ureolyticus TaxID=827 RepID=UPI0022B4A9ED|nr:hypothetical protein [Campylobacter ureolyticus]MCZ6106233.1 hypothetical protein [Campylobacter ureolyticus]MCZ6158785.1 hypothetical protein [Campylobacter ureolyticus]